MAEILNWTSNLQWRIGSRVDRGYRGDLEILEVDRWSRRWQEVVICTGITLRQGGKVAWWNQALSESNRPPDLPSQVPLLTHSANPSCHTFPLVIPDPIPYVRLFVVPTHHSLYSVNHTPPPPHFREESPPIFVQRRNFASYGEVSRPYAYTHTHSSLKKAPWVITVPLTPTRFLMNPWRRLGAGDQRGQGHWWMIPPRASSGFRLSSRGLIIY